MQASEMGRSKKVITSPLEEISDCLSDRSANGPKVPGKSTVNRNHITDQGQAVIIDIVVII